MKNVLVKGELRTVVGKRSTKDARLEGTVPCVLYGGKETIHFTAPESAFRSLIYTPDFKKADIEIDGQVYEAVLKEKQFHPVTERLLHLDFLQLVPGKRFIVDVPVVLKGTAKGVLAGGKLLQKVRRLRMSITPELLTDTVVLSIDNLDLGKSLRVRDITVPEGAIVVSAPSIPVVSVEIPRALRSAQAKEAGKK